MNEKIISPLDGKVVYSENVNDDAFSKKLVGDGIGVIPTTGILSSVQTVCAPMDGEVVMLFDTKHAVGIKSKEGAEILIHIGIDTVALNGKYFSNHVKVGDQVTAGEKLISVDFKKVKKEGYDPVTLILCTSGEVDIVSSEGNVKKGSVLYSLRNN